MGKSENNISQPPEGTPRPSLFSAGTPATDHNILDAMTSRGNPAPASRPRRRVWLLVPLLAAVGWGIATQLQPAPASQPNGQTAAVTAPPAAPANVAPVTAPLAPATPAASISAVATPASPFNTLETAAVAGAQSGTPTTAQAPAPFDMQAALDTPAPQVATRPLPQAKAATGPSKSVASGQPAASKAAKTAAAQPAAPKAKVAKATAPAETRTAAKAAAPASKKTSGRDPDVELLSAIMKHLGDENGTPAAPARSAQTIAELVKSCKGKDAIEALLCQRRICEGSWGKAQACPPNLAPKQTAKAVAEQSSN